MVVVFESNYYKVFVCMYVKKLADCRLMIIVK